MSLKLINEYTDEEKGQVVKEYSYDGETVSVTEVTSIPSDESEVESGEGVEEIVPKPDALQVLMSETKYQTMLLEFMNNMSMK